MVKAGITAADVPSLYAFAAEWKGTADLGLMLASIDRWRAKPRASPNGVHLPPHLQQRIDRWVIERQTLKQPIEPYPEALLGDIEAWKRSRLVGAQP